MKKIVCFALAMVMLLSTAIFSGVSSVFAAEIIPVYLDGDLLAYESSDAQPQIYTNRTYVPIRRTAESLGLSLDWNSKTETMTFARDGVTISHTMRSTIVYVNGSPVTFDTPSINVKNRTLMPVRMLAESIGAQVEWDNDKRCVYITSTGTPKITGVKSGSTIVENGKSVTLSATATAATKVKFVDADTNALIEEVTEYADGDNGERTFEMKYIPENNTTEPVIKNVYAYAGNNSGYIENLDNAGKLVIMVSGKDSADKDKDEDEDEDEDEDTDYESKNLVKCTLESKKVVKGEYANLTIVTTDEISRVKVTNSFASTKAEVSKYTEKSNSDREFEVKTKINARGSIELYVYLYNEDDEEYEEEYETIELTGVYEDEDEEEYDDMEIIEVELYEDTVYKGESAYVTISTSTDITEVAIFDEDEDKVARSLYQTSKLKNKYIWELDFEVKHSGKEKYTVVCYNDDDDEVEETFKLTGESYSTNDTLVVSVTQKTDDVVEGEDCRFDAKCTSGVSYIIVTDARGNELDKVTSGSKNGNFRKFSFTIDDIDFDTEYSVYCYDSSDKGTSYKFKPRVTEAEEVKINDVIVEDKSVDLDDEVNVTIYTSTNVEKVWIEDSDEERVSKKASKPDDEKSSEYIWELDFTAEETGKRTYTVFAEDEDENTDNYDFKITVSK